MKHKLILTVFAVLVIASMSKAQVYLGPALVYGTSIDEPGLQVSGYVPIPQVENLSVGGDLTFYFGHKYSGTVGGYHYSYTDNFWEINANAHYSFYDEKDLSAYGIGGLNITAYHSKSTDNAGNSSTYSESKPGLNLGVGGSKKMDFGSIFAEIKYVITRYDHLTIGAGVRFPIKTK